jgi:hypothetical protein
MQSLNRKSMFIGLITGLGLAVSTGILMGQGASQPVKSEAQYFVTGEGDHAHLWVREGANLRVVGHGECKAGCPWESEHKEGDGHDHGKPAPKK